VEVSTPGEMARLRISDADRDKAASVLSQAMAEGRITADEHAQRLDGVYAAKTQADIVPLVSDLPGAGAALEARAAPDAPAMQVSRRTPARLVSVFSSTERRGRWRAPEAIGALSVFGHTGLDLRDAVLPGKEVSVRAVCVFGNVTITVPPEMHVVDTGWALFGGREMPPDTDESLASDAPVLQIRGVSVFGLATVRRKQRGA
jgi:hypothetical protein